ncbi:MULTISPECIES: hypothetical protein [Micromonospora]|uniref:Uncharacterized protein n=1 Tax=Micromonospora yangpuensis TaxID=683228 RepID=A0A1C6UDN5_9ACTN|nr:hypothetical protein [Micromonospora yangpuensis]GGM26886.1 hypothetical protein GCM10012279_51730 [Micromonospora yangpuensis]SCL52013.1 hypothetical protein GA0070617_1952 [Micromonospora yangpuensis]
MPPTPGTGSGSPAAPEDTPPASAPLDPLAAAKQRRDQLAALLPHLELDTADALNDLPQADQLRIADHPAVREGLSFLARNEHKIQAWWATLERQPASAAAQLRWSAGNALHQQTMDQLSSLVRAEIDRLAGAQHPPSATAVTAPYARATLPAADNTIGSGRSSATRPAGSTGPGNGRQGTRPGPAAPSPG